MGARFVHSSLLIVWAFYAAGFGTYSIVAVDTLTREAGGAGATCIKSASTSVSIISDIHPGVGVIHTQASYVESNQDYAGELMDAGLAPRAIIDSLTAHDAQRTPGVRQYGVAALLQGGLTAGFTGDDNSDYKGHLLGPTYAIQGNILLGPSVLEGMEDAFLAATGSLADKLVAALGGGAVAGADTRCQDWGTSAVSAFVRVARPDDSPNNPFLNIDVNNFASRTEPVDALTEQYIVWKEENVAAARGVLKPYGLALSRPFGNASPATLTFELARETHVDISVYSLRGEKTAVVFSGLKDPGPQSVSWDAAAKDGGLQPSQVYLLKIRIGRFAAAYTLVDIP